jgi:biotin operon repressor
MRQAEDLNRRRKTMVSEVERERLRRLKEKHADGLLLWELKNGYELSPRESELVLETAKGILLGGRVLERGKQRVVGIVLGESAGKTMEEVEKKEVVVSVDGGIEDIEYEHRHGRIGLRSMRMLRVIEEGIDQGVVFSTEDLGRMLGISTRTVKRDVQRLRKEGCEVQTRGYYEGIGRAKSHKARIVELYLQGKTYAEIETGMRHTMQAIKRYVETFGRVVYALRRKKLRPAERSYVLGISEALLREYQKLYSQALRRYPERLKEIVERYGGGAKVLEYKELDRRKESFRIGGSGKKRRATYAGD